jgi:hypothetical protein
MFPYGYIWFRRGWFRRGGFCRNELILEFQTKSMLSAGLSR